MTAVHDLAEEFGVSFRQLDYWIRQGYLHTAPNEKTGSGYLRQMEDSEVKIAHYMVRLVNAGLTVNTAALCARRFVVEGTRETTLPGGVVIKVRKRYATD